MQKEHPKTEWLRSLKFGDIIYLADRYDMTYHMVIDIKWKPVNKWITDSFSRREFMSRKYYDENIAGSIANCRDTTGFYITQESPDYAYLCPIRRSVYYRFPDEPQVRVHVPYRITVRTELFERFFPFHPEFVTLAEMDNINILREHFKLTPLTK